MQQLHERVEVHLLSVHLRHDLGSEGIADEVGRDAVAHGLHAQFGNAVAHLRLAQFSFPVFLRGDDDEQHDDERQKQQQGYSPAEGGLLLFQLALFQCQGFLVFIVHDCFREAHLHVVAGYAVVQRLVFVHLLAVLLPLFGSLIQSHEHLVSQQLLFGNHPFWDGVFLYQLLRIGYSSFLQRHLYALGDEVEERDGLLLFGEEGLCLVQ